MKEPVIFFTIPTDDGTMEAAAMPALANWKRRYKIHYEPTIHHQPLDSARNTALYKFLQDKQFTHFVGMDNDIVPGDDTLPKLLDADKLVIAAFMFCVKNDADGNPCPIPLVYERDGDTITFKKNTKNIIEEVDVFPGGFYVFKREIFDKVKLPLFGYRYDKYGRKSMGSDVFASEKLQKAGIKSHVHMRAFCDQMVKCGTMAMNNTLVKYASPERKEGRKEELLSVSGES